MDDLNREMEETTSNEETLKDVEKVFLPRTDELYNKVQVALDEIRPYLQSDGGDADIVGIREDKIVELSLVGACGSCPMSMVTLKNGIEQAIIRAVPEIVGVDAI